MFEWGIRGRILGVLEDWCAKSDDNHKIFK